MKLSWILFIARRYFRVKRKTSGIASSFIAVGGLTVGVMALIAVLSVMNGFQLGFIDDILEISSFHLRLTPPPKERGMMRHSVIPWPFRKGSWKIPGSARRSPLGMCRPSFREGIPNIRPV